LELADGSKLNPMQFLKHFGFKPESHYTYVSKLSGGEKRRLYLLTVLIKNPNFLILDEPTNDLDILTLNILEDFLEHFQGVVIMVSHDRYFMDKLVDHLFIFDGTGDIRDFNGNYTDYRLMLDDAEKAKREKPETPKSIPLAPQNALGKRKMSFKEKHEYESLEKDIPKLESQKKDLENQLSASMTDYEKIGEITTQIGELTEKIEEKSMRWLELSERTDD
jgi:ATP-binding cassette subfamily F protein uup